MGKWMIIIAVTTRGSTPNPHHSLGKRDIVWWITNCVVDRSTEELLAQFASSPSPSSLDDTAMLTTNTPLLSSQEEGKEAHWILLSLILVIPFHQQL